MAETVLPEVQGPAPQPPTPSLSPAEALLAEVLPRLRRLEEAAAIPRRWHYLIERPSSWRKQLYLKGRNLTVGQLVSTVKANRLTPEQASENLELPVPAILEALLYYEENRALIQAEAAEERRALVEAGCLLTPEENPHSPTYKGARPEGAG
jgi:hypothetical protein